MASFNYLVNSTYLCMTYVTLLFQFRGLRYNTELKMCSSGTLWFYPFLWKWYFLKSIAIYQTSHKGEGDFLRFTNTYAGVH